MDKVISVYFVSKNYRQLLLMSIVLLFSSCATNSLQVGRKVQEASKKTSNPIHSFYLFGDSDGIEKNPEHLSIIQNELNNANSKSSVIWLGNNAEVSVLQQFSKNSKLKNYIVNGENEWKNGFDELKNLNNQYQQNNLQVLPESICGIQTVEVNDSLAILAVDSQWFLEDWNDHPKASESCPIQTRDMFFDEFQNQLNEYQNRTTVIVMHHPLISNGKHGGKFSVKDQLYPLDNKIPLPIAGSVINLVRSTSGITNQDLQNHRYREFSQRISTLIGKRDNVMIFSAHDKSLQLLRKENVRQIISGSIAKTDAAKAAGKNDFSLGEEGFVKVDIYADGSSEANFYVFDQTKFSLVHQQDITPKRKEYLAQVYDKKLPSSKSISVFSQEEITKSKTYQKIFGIHYRPIYGDKILAKTLDLEASKINPIREREELQTINLRLSDDKNEFLLVPIKKNANQLIQSIAYKNEYIATDFENTFTQKFIRDFQTTQHPYYPLVINNLADDASVNQIKSSLYYVPKQENLKEYNENFGDELYFLEHLPTVTDTLNNFITTEEMLNKTIENNRQIIDREQYIRARLLDMLVGDWNRNESQWLWKKNTKGDEVIYEPYSKTREFIFPKYDGAFFSLLMRLAPFRHMESYKDKIRNVKWFNKIAYPLDLAILQNTTEEEWTKQAEILQNSITESSLKSSFDKLPKEIKSNYDEETIRVLMERKNQLVDYAKEYQKVIDQLVILKGTNEDEIFEVNRVSNGSTQIVIKNKITSQVLFDKTFHKSTTKEIRLYGMNGKDEFVQKGKTSNNIKLRMIGGLDDDSYNIENGRKLYVYDDKNNKDLNPAFVYDDYEINTYNYKNPKYNTLTLLPNVGFNPDDGVKLGLISNLTINGFDRKPYSQKHQLQFNYFFATDAIEAKYKGTFMKSIGKWNFDLNASYTTPSFSTNYFGLGNATVNNQKDLGMDYNRVRMQTYSFGPSFFKTFNNNGRLDIFANYNHIKIEKNLDRIVNDNNQIRSDVFNGQSFGEVGASYSYKNYDNLSLPTMGMTVFLTAKWVNNLEDFDRNFQYAEANIGFTHKLTNNGRFTVASMVKGKSIFGNGYEFFQAAYLGGDQDLRGYRLGRFRGEQVFLHSTDIRYNVTKIKMFIPLRLGVFTGADYGRVWMKDETSNKWHSAFGGGVWVNGARSITGTLSYFKGEDPGRVVFGLNFGF